MLTGGPPACTSYPRGEVTVRGADVDADLQPMLDRVAAAQAALFAGDSAPYTACWAPSDDVTLFGAFGTREKGHRRVTDTFAWVASRFSDGEMVAAYDTVEVCGDLAYTVGFERGTVRVDDGEPGPMTIRVTHIYKRIDGDWYLVHRHGDHPPPDPRLAP